MGGCNCNCLLKNPENNNEMVNGVIPGLGMKTKNDNFNEIKIINTENDDFENNNEKNENNNNINEKNNENNNSLLINEDNEKKESKENEEDIANLKLTNIQTGLSPNFPKKMLSDDSSVLSKMHDLSETIFDYFNEIRTTPYDFERDAEEHKVWDVLQKFTNDSNSCNNLIVNSYYNLLLSSYINSNTSDGENNEQLMEMIEKEEKIKNYNKKLFVIDGDINEPNEVVWKLIENNKDIAEKYIFSNSVEFLVISCQKINPENFKSYFLFLSKILN